MDYEKKYKEALEKARQFSEHPLQEDSSNIVEYIFPELQESKDERIRKEIIETFKNLGDGKIPVDINYADIFTWLEKQGKQEQLYIRFGEIPTDEKSKIYQGEIEVGTENGVSVYPAFKTDEGDIVLGLILPITKTTLYTQQHLIEYDDRPCYLVKGDYVGKDTDGQPLINNVSIIEKIDTYRVKEEKQDEQKPSNKVESKFHEGDWVVCEAGEWTSTLQITGIKNGCYWFHDDTYLPVVDEECLHLWTIGDARDGDVLAVEPIKDCPNSFIAIYKERGLNFFNSYCFVSLDGEFNKGTTGHDIYLIHPATKEQRDTLFAKMTEAGYEWDAEKKELKKIEEPENFKNQIMSEMADLIKNYIRQKPAEWGEDDENTIKVLMNIIRKSEVIDSIIYTDSLKEKLYDWLKSIRERCTWKPSDEQIVVLELASKYERVFTPKEIDILIDLKEQLKKLKVE